MLLKAFALRKCIEHSQTDDFMRNIKWRI